MSCLSKLNIKEILRDLEKKLTDSDIDISQISHQLAELIEAIQEHEDRWIELSELSELAK